MAFYLFNVANRLLAKAISYKFLPVTAPSFKKSAAVFAAPFAVSSSAILFAISS
jgi:hypothetical protein